MSREHANRLAAASLAQGDGTGWFERLYATAPDEGAIPWADLVPNPALVAWLDAHGGDGAGRRALVAGAGLGDDAEALAARGFTVTAFDIAPTAVAWARRRWPESAVEYVVADAADPPSAWEGAFDLVVEIYTLQAVPVQVRERVAVGLASTVAPGGTLLAVALGRSEGEDPGAGPPWALSAAELRRLLGRLELVELDDRPDDEDPPKRRLVATFTRPA